MSDSEIQWYSINRDLALQEHGTIGLQQALDIVQGYVVRGGEHFASGEDAIAATMFGFQRSKSVFIEISINGPNQISYTFEMSEPAGSWIRRIFPRIFRREEELRSHEELVQKVTEFFTTPAEEIKRRLGSKVKAGRKRRFVPR